MKLQYRLTSLFLTLAFTSALSAATIPQLKSPPKAPAAPRVVKAPVAVKAPVVPKAPVAPKIPTIAKIPSAPKVPSVKVPAVAKIPAAPKVVSVPKAPVVKAPVVAKVPNVAIKPGSAINTGRLNNLKQKVQIDSSKFSAVGGAGGRFVSDNFGNAAAKKPGSLMDGIKQGSSGGRDRNPLAGSQLDNMRGDRNGQVSDDSKKSSTVNFSTTVKNKDGSESTHYSDGSSMRSYENGTVIYTDEKGKSTYMPGRGVAAPFVPTRPMFNGSTEPPKRSTVNGSTGSGAKTPTPDDNGDSGTTVVTKNDFRGINAKKNGTSEPSQDEAGSGGALNTGANGTGKTGSLSQPVADAVGAASLNVSEAAETIRVKIESKINTGGR